MIWNHFLFGYIITNRRVAVSNMLFNCFTPNLGVLWSKLTLVQLAPSEAPDEGETPGKTIVEVEWANWGTLQNVVHDVHWYIVSRVLMGFGRSEGFSFCELKENILLKWDKQYQYEHLSVVGFAWHHWIEFFGWKECLVCRFNYLDSHNMAQEDEFKKALLNI